LGLRPSQNRKHKRLNRTQGAAGKLKSSTQSYSKVPARSEITSQFKKPKLCLKQFPAGVEVALQRFNNSKAGQPATDSGSAAQSCPDLLAGPEIAGLGLKMCGDRDIAELESVIAQRETRLQEKIGNTTGLPGSKCMSWNETQCLRRN